MHEQTEVCRFLLNQTTWPDHAGTLDRAFGQYYPDRSKEALKMYRLFVKTPDFEADLNDTTLYRWLYYCCSEKCLNLVLKSLFPEVFRLSLEERFELAFQVGYGSPMERSGFLRCIGLRALDKRLPF